jgi:uncharacterized protein
MYKGTRCTMRHWVLGWCAVLCMINVVPLQAGDVGKQHKADEVLDELLTSHGVLISHPDLWYRELGRKAYEDGKPAFAKRLFLRSARYADKPSQAIIATMYWNGDGAERNRPLAYAWMDLAADRGYPELLVQRERYWKALTPTERDQAKQLGREVYAEYNDAAGLKRLQLQLSMEFRRSAIGSRTGFAGTTGFLLMPNNSGLFQELQGNRFELMKFYDSALWQAADYARLKDLQWLGEDRFGHVTVGPLQAVSPAAAPGHVPDKESKTTGGH